MATPLDPASSPAPAVLDEEELCAAVVAYLAENPGAMDTFDGVAEWWITRRLIRVEAERLSRALEALTQRGILEEFMSGDERFYRLRHRIHSRASDEVT